jgi:hypothetical protein
MGSPGKGGQVLRHVEAGRRLRAGLSKNGTNRPHVTGEHTTTVPCGVLPKEGMIDAGCAPQKRHRVESTRPETLSSPYSVPASPIPHLEVARERIGIAVRGRCQCPPTGTGVREQRACLACQG